MKLLGWFGGARSTRKAGPAVIIRRTALFAPGALLLAAACGTGSTASGSSGSGGTSGSSTDSGADSSAAGSGGTAGTGGTVGRVSCTTPSTAYANNGGSCGAWRWGVKTGTDQDVGKVNLVPEVTTIQTLISLPTPSVSYCKRQPAELETYELENVTLKFERLETDSDYHLIASDGSGHSMLVEVPYPGCVGHKSCTSGTPWRCAITHARAAVDAKNPGAKSYAQLGTATVVGVGFFDTFELSSKYPPTGMAPNGVELHPVLAICFGQGCDPLKP